MVATLDVLSALPEFEWRGVKYPITSARYSFRHDDAEHKLSFGEVTLREKLGPQAPTFVYTLPMRQGVAIGDYDPDLFKQVPKLEADCWDRVPGDLVDPIYGKWTCTPTEYSSEINPRTGRDGIDVQVGFVWAPNLDDDVRSTGGVQGIAGLRSDAGALDAEVEALSRKYDVPSPEPTINPLDAASAIAGQLDRNYEKISAQLSDFTRRVEKTERWTTQLIRDTRDPDAFGANRQARKVRASAERTKKEIADLTADIVQITVEQTKNVLTIAAEAGMTFKELASLNSAIAATPSVPAGTVIQVYK
jgi:hypothetical protein